MTDPHLVNLEEAMSSIRGLILGSGRHPKSDRKTLAAINEIVGFALYGDFEDSKWVKRHKRGEL